VEERLLGFAAELVQLKVDVLVSAAISGIRAAKQATKTIPIVMMITGDPVALGLIDPNPDFEGAFQVATSGRVSALIADTGGLAISYRKLIADLAIKNRIPSMCERSDYVEAGCLMSYSADEAESFRRAAVYVDKILKGAKPADLPVEQPTKFEFIINLKTAKQIGVTIPPNVLARANRVIK